MHPIYLGFVGPIASGKGVLVSHLQKRGFTVFSLSDKVREEARRRGLPITREVLQDLGNELRETYGNQILAERTIFDIIGTPGNIAIDSIRNPGEIECLRSFTDNVKIIGVDAPPELRAQWYTKRATDRGEDGTDIASFIKANLRDSGYQESSSGQQVDQCLKMADIIFRNEGTEKEIQNSLDQYLLRELNFSPEGSPRYKERK